MDLEFGVGGLEVFEGLVFEFGIGEFFVEFFDGILLFLGLGLELLVVGVVEGEFLLQFVDRVGELQVGGFGGRDLLFDMGDL